MEVESSLFETSEMAANLLASTNILLDSWNICNQANYPNSEGFVINQNGTIGFVGFAGLKDFQHGFGSNLKDMVPIQVNGLFVGLDRHGDDHEEPVMVHAGFLQLFLGVFSTPSFQTKV